MTIIWCMVPEIWSATDRTFCHSGWFFCPFTPLWTQKIKIWKNEKNTWRYHFTNVCHKWLSYNVWFLRYVVQWTEFFVILDPFFALYPPLTWKIKFLKKMKKPPGDIMTIIWCMVPEIPRSTDIIFCHFGPFLHFYPPNNPKNQNFEKLEKTSGDRIILHKCTKNYDHMLYCSLFICNYLMLVHQNSSSLIKTN